MKNYSKVGKSTGKVAYRTPSSFQYKKHAQEAKKSTAKRVLRAQNLAKRSTHSAPRSKK